jgi:hypothetical protein
MLLLSGCSYVDNYDFPSIAFGKPVYHKHRCKITAWSGAGNHYISRSILDNLTPDVDRVFVLWSGLCRIDLEVPVESSDDFVSYFEGTPVHTVGQTTWFHSGGYDGTWCNWTRTKYKKYIYDYMKSQYRPLNWKYLAQKSLQHVAGCLNTLEAKGIEYRFGFIHDIFRDYSNTQQSLGGPVSRDEPLLNLINWDKCLSSTPYEYCTERNLLASDNFHPTHEGYTSWWDSVRNEIPFDI